MPSEFQPNRRSVVGGIAAAATATLAGCAAGSADTSTSASEATDSDRTNQWPEPKDGQREVMLLGTTHSAQPPGDTPNAYATDPGNAPGEQRQREPETLTDRLAERNPDRIAVEHAAFEQSPINSAFNAYDDGRKELSGVSSWEGQKSNEIVQVGFRLADKLGHDSLAAVGYRQSPAALLTDEERKQLPNSLQEFLIDSGSVACPLSTPARYIEEQQRQRNENPPVEFYKYLNGPLTCNHLSICRFPWLGRRPLPCGSCSGRT